MKPMKEILTPKFLTWGIVVLALISIVVSVIFILGSGENAVVQEAKEALAANEIEKGYEILKKGSENNQLDQEGQALYVEVQEYMYNTYFKKASSAKQKNQYREAYEAYKIVLETTTNQEEAEKIEEIINTLETQMYEQEALQKQLDRYMETFKMVIDDSNILLSDYKRALDEVKINKMSAEQFVESVKNKISKSNQISTMLDKALYMKNEELLNIHKTLINDIQFQHDMLLQSLELKEENKKELIDIFNSQYLKIKQNQVSIIQRLNLFAEKNHLTNPLIGSNE